MPLVWLFLWGLLCLKGRLLDISPSWESLAPLNPQRVPSKKDIPSREMELEIRNARNPRRSQAQFPENGWCELGLEGEGLFPSYLYKNKGCKSKPPIQTTHVLEQQAACGSEGFARMLDSRNVPMSP